MVEKLVNSASVLTSSMILVFRIEKFIFALATKVWTFRSQWLPNIFLCVQGWMKTQFYIHISHVDQLEKSKQTNRKWKKKNFATHRYMQIKKKSKAKQKIEKKGKKKKET